MTRSSFVADWFQTLVAMFTKSFNRLAIVNAVPSTALSFLLAFRQTCRYAGLTKYLERV